MSLDSKLSQKASDKTIFVTNIPYDTTEQSIKNYLESFNLTIKSVHVAIDPITSKSEGIASVELNDIVSAQNAITIVNNKEMHGRRLKVTAYDPTNQPIGIDTLIYADSQMRSFFGHTHSYEPDEVAEAMSKLNKDQLIGLLKLVKLLDKKDPSKAYNLLMKYPSISRVLFLAEIILGLIRVQPLPSSKVEVMCVSSDDLSDNNDMPSFPSSQPSSGYVVSSATPLHIDSNISNLSTQTWSSTRSCDQSIEERSSTALNSVQKQALNVIINMSQAQIAQLPDEKRKAVLQIRNQLNTSS